VTDAPSAADGGPRRGRRVGRRPGRIIGAILLVGVIAAIAFAAAPALTGSGGRTPTTASGAPHFVEEAVQAGLDHRYEGDFRFAVGGGVAALDCDEDGKPDLYLAGGSQPATLYRNVGLIGGPLRFERLADPAIELAGVTGAYPIDIDGDGRVDLVVLRAGETVLLRGLGDCRFERANERWSVAGGDALASAFSATWEGSATLPTLAFGSYLGLDAAGQPTSTCGENTLVRPDPAGTRYGAPIILSPGYCALSMLFSSWDHSGRRDLRVSNDREFYDAVNGQEQLWRVQPGAAPRLYTDADGWVALQIEGMGIASYDLTNDGYPEVFLTSQGPNRLQTLLAGASQPSYRDIGLKRGVYAETPFAGGDPLPSTAWHPEFADVNNDGFIDLFISKGNVDAQPGHATKDPSNLLIGRPDGTFVEGADAAGILDYARGRGAALVDFNLDGQLDLVQVDYHDRVQLWRNVGSGTAARPEAMGHWIGLRLVQPAPDGDAIGAWVEVRVGDLTLRRELSVGGGHAGGQLGWIHFGLGPATAAEVRVQWPDGVLGPWQHVAADGFVVIERGAAEPRRWVPGGQ
jgi:hypothetical protein